MTQHYFTDHPAGPERRRSNHARIVRPRRRAADRDGVFSGDGLDLGTAVLLRQSPAPDREPRLLDLGCGYGPIAVALALGCAGGAGRRRRCEQPGAGSVPRQRRPTGWPTASACCVPSRWRRAADTTRSGPTRRSGSARTPYTNSCWAGFPDSRRTAARAWWSAESRRRLPAAWLIGRGLRADGSAAPKGFACWRSGAPTSQSEADSLSPPMRPAEGLPPRPEQSVPSASSVPAQGSQTASRTSGQRRSSSAPPADPDEPQHERPGDHADHQREPGHPADPDRPERQADVGSSAEVTRLVTPNDASAGRPPLLPFLNGFAPGGGAGHCQSTPTKHPTPRPMSISPT